MKSSISRLFLLGMASFLALISCTSCQNTRPSNNSGEGQKVDSILVSHGPNLAMSSDTIPMPIYLMANGDYLQLLYWTDVEEPQRNEEYPEYYEEQHGAWATQEALRRRLPQYTHLINGDRLIDIRFHDEVLKDPDGNTPSIGELHGRPEIPSLCARFVPADEKIRVEDLTGMVAVTDSYLQSRKLLAIDEPSEETYPALLDSILRKVEAQYGMKVSRSVWCATIGQRYLQGCLQFKGEYKNAPKDDRDYKKSLALEVLVDSGRVYADEVLGYYLSDEDFGWNVDDGGEYIPSQIVAAFEGPQGLELCYWRGAPESLTVGMYVLRDGKYEQQSFDMYHYMIDEEIPIWKKDIAEMQQLYLDRNPTAHKGIELVRCAHCYLDYSNEWIWLRDKDNKYGAFFIRKDGKLSLIAVETPQMKPTQMSKDGINYLKLSGNIVDTTTRTEIYGFKEGKQVEHFIATAVSGVITECSLNGDSLDKERGQAYLDKLPEGEEVTAYFPEI